MYPSQILYPSGDLTNSFEMPVISDIFMKWRETSLRSGSTMILNLWSIESAYKINGLQRSEVPRRECQPCKNRSVTYNTFGVWDFKEWRYMGGIVIEKVAKV